MDAMEARYPDGSCSDSARRPVLRFLTLGAIALALLGSTLLAACASPKPAQPAFTVAAVDSVLGELGGRLTSSLRREQRWRLISSVGTGLPPQNYQLSDLPDPDSYGAKMLDVYCTQCHWLPSPQMHSAAEWPLLVNRMLLRSRMLQHRLGGPVIDTLLGRYMVYVMKNAATPAPDRVDSLVAYLKRNALPTARPAELGSSAAARLFVERCSVCHQTPTPKAHTASEWPTVVARMQSNMAKMELPQLSGEDVKTIVTFLQKHAGR